MALNWLDTHAQVGSLLYDQPIGVQVRHVIWHQLLSALRDQIDQHILHNNW
jgi:hypothetical protein